MMITFIIPILIIILLPEDVYAWGVGIHIMEGSYVLENLQLILPSMADVLRTFPMDYLYGCISADIFIGKGERRKDDHCHNWSVGQKILSLATSDIETAFSYGYLSHLASDIIAHNFYIPNQLYSTSSNRGLGHIYWELRSDEYTARRHWKLAREVINRHNGHNDGVMQEVIPKKLVSFKAKKRIYSRAIEINDLILWRKAIAIIAKNSRWDVGQDYIEYLNSLSINLILDLFQNIEDAVCLKFDPIGSENIKAAKEKKKIIYGRTIPMESLFDIPEEITTLSPKNRYFVSSN
ncbi:MAG: zinc dependent phospholipase C family protein [Nitrospinae bacterium]|nr:zinc dependent phospholipase C family protein [Nitrospinota bacterium]